MNDKPQASQQHGAGEDNSHLVRESQAMRRVVRNIVANMETVLNDLQGIMGDIQSLVVQIDSVTDKIDKQCGAHDDKIDKQCGARHDKIDKQCGARDDKIDDQSGAHSDSGDINSRTLEHCVRKPEFVHGRQLPSGAVHNMMYTHTATEVETDSPSEFLLPEGETSRHNVLQVKAFRTDDKSGISVVKDQPRPYNTDTSRETDKQREIRLPCSSKRFSRFSKEGTGIVSPSGGIAIVYPTRKGAPTESSDYLEPAIVSKTGICVGSSAAIKTSDDSSSLGKSSPSKRNKLASKSEHVLSTSPLQDNETSKTKNKAAKQRYGITSVYNTFFQPVTPTEQRSPVIPVAHRHGHSKASINENVKPSSPTKDSKLYRVSYPIPERSTILNSPGHKYCTIGSALAISLRNQRESTLQRFIPSSPLLRGSSTKAVYNRVHGSPASSRSPGSIRRPGSENYYFSIESDLDSDALIETLDNRTMTPDIDWSYLNLVGSDNIIGGSSRLQHASSSNLLYDVPVTRPAQPFQMLQTSPDVVARLAVSSFQAQQGQDVIYAGQDTEFMFHGQGVLGQPFNNSVVAHIFCSEVSSFTANGYCGCYESVLDSVLENIAGFESFEEACEDIDNEEAIIDTYVSFDDEFEEDDWDVGMKSDDQGEYELDPFNPEAFSLYDQDFFERLDTPDDNRNIFAAIDSTISFRLYGTDADSTECAVLTGSAEDYNLNANYRSNKRRLSPVFSDADMYDHLAFPESTGNSFGDDDCCAIKPSISTKHENFILLRKSCIPNDLRLRNNGRNKSVTDLDNDMSSSDDTSCQAIGTGSPMSFSSPEAALTSPDTDRFVTSSEGDDLFTSQEEGYFHFSDTQDNANMSAARANMLQLRQEFFQSLYNVCDKRDRERLQDIQANTISEESMRYDHCFSRMDNSKDNISEAGSYHEDVTSYNKNINTWTAYACVHIQSEDIADSTTDIFNENNISCSMTSSYLDADNIGTAPAGQGLSC